MLDDEMTAALTRFVRDVAGDAVTVTFRDGVASLRGRVESPTQARALRDLVRWHDGVEQVEAELTYSPANTPQIPLPD